MCFDLALLAATSLSIERDSVEVLELGRVLLDVNWSLRLNPNRGYLERFDEIKTHKNIIVWSYTIQFEDLQQAYKCQKQLNLLIVITAFNFDRNDD